ncbi:hypothetical protein SUDANB126_00043 [Streptomyces sp. enrichment culture]
MLFADRGYGHDKYRCPLWARDIRPVIAGPGRPHGSGLGTFRWAVERTVSWLHGFRRPRSRWERRDDIHEALLGLATCLITHRHVQRLCWDRQDVPSGARVCIGRACPPGLETGPASRAPVRPVRPDDPLPNSIGRCRVIA